MRLGKGHLRRHFTCDPRVILINKVLNLNKWRILQLQICLLVMQLYLLQEILPHLLVSVLLEDISWHYPSFVVKSMDKVAVVSSRAAIWTVEEPARNSSVVLGLYLLRSHLLAGLKLALDLALLLVQALKLYYQAFCFFYHVLMGEVGCGFQRLL
mmetsp:Transcript_13043/g.9435  ORF Transcript_13043/g.9435 Transcript_13043/m.9435 type:complete len:155 (-) Transcript_13043:68-532(-)